MAKRGEIRVTLVEPASQRYFETIKLVADQVYGHAY